MRFEIQIHRKPTLYISSTTILLLLHWGGKGEFLWLCGSLYLDLEVVFFCKATSHNNHHHRRRGFVCAKWKFESAAFNDLI